MYLGGEGRHELGGWVHAASYRRPDERGVLVALLERCGATDWTVVDARCWKDIPKYQVKRGIHGAETRIVLGLAALAARAGCDVLAFVRDSDSALERVEEIEAAADRIRDVAVIGGAAVRTLDAWCLALGGMSGTEALRQPKERLESSGCSTTQDRVDLVDRADLSTLPPDARSLRRWIDRARAVAMPDDRGPSVTGS